MDELITKIQWVLEDSDVVGDWKILYNPKTKEYTIVCKEKKV
jgi:hypothetical protein